MDELQAKFCQKKLQVLERQRSEYDNAVKEAEDQLEALRQRCEQLGTTTTTKTETGETGKLTNEEIARYSRQIILPNFGVSGQLKLKNASVLIVGAGGLGKIAFLITVISKCLIKTFLLRLSIVATSRWSWSWAYWSCRLRCRRSE